MFVLCTEVLLCWVHRYLQLLCLPLRLTPWSLCSVLPCPLWYSYFKVYVVLYKDLYSSFLLLPICMEYIFPLTFSLYVSLGVKWVSCRQPMYGSCFCIHSACLCLLVGAFNPFIFQVIIDIYVPSIIFVIDWGWFCRSFFFFCISWLYKSNICCNAALVVLNCLNFCLSEQILISPSILNEILAGYSNLGCRFFPFGTLNIFCHSLLAFRVSAERTTLTGIGFNLYVTCCFSLAAFNIISLCLVFVSLVSMCLAGFLLWIILYGALCAYWTWSTISFSMLGKLSTIMSSKYFSYPFFFSLLLGPLIFEYWCI